MGKSKKGKILLIVGGLFLLAVILICSNLDSIKLKLVNWDSLYELYGFATEEEMEEERKELPYYGENRELTSDYDESLSIKCNNGIFVGETEDGVKCWKGIPYAAQPIGELRWKAPKAAEDSERVYEAVNFGHVAIQGPYIEETASLYTQGEDCLNLNIWAKDEDSEELRPIMVYIHGGAYIGGGSADPYYDCKRLAEDNSDVIFVTLNYRLGFFGFSNFEKVKGGEAYAGTDNLGILDQIEALKWIKKNAASFGGDSNNITLFGESAGAGSIMAMVASDLTDGLFNHAIAESGNAYSFVRTKETSQDYTRILMKTAGAGNMEDLLALSSEQLAEADLRTYMYTSLYTFPVCDGYVLSDNILEDLEVGKGKDIDILTGTNKDEMRYWLWNLGSEETFLEIEGEKFNTQMKPLGKKGEKWLSDAMKEWGITGESEKILMFFNFSKFHTPAREEAKAHVRGGGQSYMYYFTEESTDPQIGSFHGFELRYVFNHPEALEYSDAYADLDLCRFIQRAWVNFAKTGNPSIPAGEVGNDEPIIWNQYSENSKEVMLLNSEGCHMTSDPLQSISEGFEKVER